MRANIKKELLYSSPYLENQLFLLIIYSIFPQILFYGCRHFAFPDIHISVLVISGGSVKLYLCINTILYRMQDAVRPYEIR